MGHSFLDLYGPQWDKYVEGPICDFADEIMSMSHFLLLIVLPY